ncbi:MAG: hypothetical protein CVV02_18490 [Firmicutes bacterium HGW-Firmicutes-7]|nr:MAG: hypothetical protein CVV02_18490 [Firmicutes bacterium HGW-Firmicutes-7]
MLRNNFGLKANLHLVRIGLIQFQVYRMATWFNIISSVFWIVIQYYFWKAVYEATVIPDYSFSQMLTYLCASQIIFILFPNTSSQLSQLVKQGDIIHWLLKPISIIRQFFFEAIGISMYRLLNILLPILLIIFLVIQIIPLVSLLNFTKFLVVFVLSYLFVFLFEFFIGLCSFYTLSTWGIQSFKYAVITLLSGRFLPLSLYPDWVREIIEHLPFKIMYYYPLQILSNTAKQSLIEMIGYQLVWTGILGILVYAFYQKVMKSIMIQGG